MKFFNAITKITICAVSLLLAAALFATPLFGYAAELPTGRPDSCQPIIITLPRGTKRLLLDDSPICPLPRGLFTFKVVESVSDGGCPTGSAFAPVVSPDGRIVFGGEITISKAGTYTYTICENPPADCAYTGDTAVFTVTYKIVEYRGALVVKDGWPVITRSCGSIKERVPSVTFINHYNPCPAVITLSGQKGLFDNAGREVDMLENQFSFECTEVRNGGDGSFTPREIVVSHTAGGALLFTIDGSGSITVPRSGSYVYTITELPSADSHYTSDGRYFTVTYNVTDVGGRLSASSPIITGYDCNDNPFEAEAVYFSNILVPDSTSSDFPIIKRLSGISQSTAEWSFVLEAVGWALPDTEPAQPPMPDGSVDGCKTIKLIGCGDANFGSVTYTAAGVYTYKIYEKSGSSACFAYDKSVYTVTDTVVLNGTALVSTRAITKAGSTEQYTIPEFVNIYTPVPDTGDSTGIVAFSILSGIAFIITIILIKKRTGASGK